MSAVIIRPEFWQVQPPPSQNFQGQSKFGGLDITQWVDALYKQQSDDFYALERMEGTNLSYARKDLYTRIGTVLQRNPEVAPMLLLAAIDDRDFLFTKLLLEKGYSPDSVSSTLAAPKTISAVNRAIANRDPETLEILIKFQANLASLQPAGEIFDRKLLPFECFARTVEGPSTKQDISSDLRILELLLPKVSPYDYVSCPPDAPILIFARKDRQDLFDAALGSGKFEPRQWLNLSRASRIMGLAPYYQHRIDEHRFT